MSERFKTIRILIFEDELKAISVLTDKLFELEENLNNVEFAITLFSEYSQIEDYVNKIVQNNFDIILLDRDCKQGGSFHVLNFSKFNPDKIISISAIPEYNDQAVKNGIKTVAWKDWNDIDGWAKRVVGQVNKKIGKITQKLA
ncbi:hypothetical protein KAJ89_04360 [Candidatus Parcubacteria bacterium]|nr:hypothetical protein [Candidatus Parcubacteria bacterium]